MTRLIATCALALCACECGAPADGGEASEAAETPALSAYFPSSRGDRWRYVAGDARATRVVMSVEEPDASGARQVVMMGTDLMGPRYHRVSDEAVVIVSPEGDALGTLLDAPVQVGHEWSYLFGDVGCEAKYTGIDEHVEVAGLTLAQCVAVERTCTHPAGSPFLVETKEIHQEVYCPGVGRIREHTRIEPPPPGTETAERDDRLVFYRVLGSPAPEIPETFDCDAFLVMATDIGAACSRALPQVSSESVEEGCDVAFGASPGAPALRVSVRRKAADATQPDADSLVEATAAELGSDEVASYGYVEGRHAIAVAAPLEVCPADSLARLGPLLKSLVRR